MLGQNLLAKPIENLLQEAVQSELYASHLYKSLANQLQRIGYFGAQKHFLSESSEELTHYQKLADFMNDMGALANLPALEPISDKVATLADAIEIAYETELQLGKDYERWYKAAAEAPMVQQRLLEFLEIQRTSIGEYGDLLSRLKLVEGDKAGLILIDQELGE